MNSFVWKHRVALLFSLFITLRLVFLFRYPPFSDEAIYVRWGQLMIQVPQLAWASLTYFLRQPLAFWLFGIGSGIFGSPFIGARLAALLVNSISFFFFADWVKHMANEKVAAISLFLFAVCPVFIFFQATALMDGLLMSAVIILLWALSKKNLAIVATASAFALWIKSTGIILVLGTAGVMLYERRKHLLTALCHVALYLGITLGLLLPLILHPQFKLLFAGSQAFTYSLSELLSFPVMVWVTNIGVILYTLLIYLTPLYPIALYFSRTQLLKRHFLSLVYWEVLTAGVVILTGKLFTTRYILLTFVPMVPLLAAGFSELLSKKWKIIGILGLALPVILSAVLIFNARWFFALFPYHTPMAQEKNYAYYWTSGYAAAEAVIYIRTMIATGPPVILSVADAPGNPSDYIMATFYKNPTLAITILNSPEDLRQQTPLFQKYPAYYIGRKDTLFPFLLPYLTEVKKFWTPDGADFVGIYSVRIPK